MNTETTKQLQNKPGALIAITTERNKMYEETDTSRIYRLSRELSEAKKNFTIIVDALIEIAKRHHSQQACAEIADEALAKVKEIPMREVDNMTNDRSSELIASYDSPSAKRIEQLERELAEAKAEAEKWEKLYDQDTEHLASLQMLDNYGPAETLNETAMRLSRELVEARQELSEWKTLQSWGGTPQIVDEFIKGQQSRIHAAQDAEEQRDMLAKALRKIDRRDMLGWCGQVAHNALAAVKGGSDE